MSRGGAAISAFLLAACGTAARPTDVAPPEVALVPHAEDFRVGPLGTGSARCEAYLYAWDGDRCRFQLDHCSLEREGSEAVVCLSLPDPRELACGEVGDACGQPVRCACPEGAAPPVPEAPGTWHVRPTGLGASRASDDGTCTATVIEIPGGPPPAPCVFAIRACDAAGACDDRQHMVSCGVRSEICGAPMRCDCD